MLWITFALGIILCVTSTEIRENRIRSVTKKLNVDLASDLSGVALQNTSFWHVSCSGKNETNVICTLQLRIQTFSLTSYSATCTVSVSHVQPGTRVIVNKFIPFTDNQLILGLGEFGPSYRTTNVLKFVIVNMKNCSTATSVIHLDKANNLCDFCENVVVLTRENEFEVSYLNTTYCKYRCEEIFDSLGNRLKGPIDLNFNEMAPAEYIEQWPVTYNNFTCFNVKPQERMNSALIFKKRANQLRENIRTSKFAGISTANGNVTICHRLEHNSTSLHCTRNDFQFWIEFDFHRQPIYSFVIRNLPGGELLVLTIEESVFVYLNKFDEGGRIVGTIKVTKLSCHDTRDLLVHLFEKNQKDGRYYCVSMVYGMNYLNFKAECYPEDIFCPAPADC